MAARESNTVAFQKKVAGKAKKTVKKAVKSTKKYVSKKSTTPPAKKTKRSTAPVVAVERRYSLDKVHTPTKVIKTGKMAIPRKKSTAPKPARKPLAKAYDKTLKAKAAVKKS